MNFEIVDPLENFPNFTEEEIHSAKTKFYSSICLIVFGVITCLIAVFGYSMVGGYNSTIQDFKYNWSLQPITDIIFHKILMISKT